MTVGSRSGSPSGVGWPEVVTGLGAVGVVIMFGVAGSAEWGLPGTPVGDQRKSRSVISESRGGRCGVLVGRRC